MSARLDPPKEIPENMREIWAHIGGETCDIRTKLIFHKQLYSSEKWHIDKLNKAGGFLFYIIDNLFMDDLTLSLARLTDPAKTKGKENLSLLRLIDEVESNDFKNKMMAQYQKIKSLVEAAQDHRNKRIAHNDLNVLTQNYPKLLPNLTLNCLHSILASIEEFLNEFQLHYSSVPFDFTMLQVPEDVDNLMIRICKSEAYDALVKEGKTPFQYWEKFYGEPAQVNP